MIEIHGRSVTFFPPAQAAFLMGDFTDWDDSPLPVTETSMTIEFPQGAYIEYAFLDAVKQPIADVQNPDRPKNPWYDYHRAIQLPSQQMQLAEMPSALQGTIRQHHFHSAFFSHSRRYWVYEPRVSPLATVYVQDGEAYYQKLHFPMVADTLIEQGLIHSLRLVLIEPQNRHNEYWFNERYEACLLQEILPRVEEEYGDTSERGLWGASLGGLFSAWLAWKHPHLFAKVGSQSGCFTAHPQGGDEYHDAEWLVEQYAATPLLPLRFYLQTGQIEWLLAPNRRFAAMLAEKAYPHSYQEHPSGHNWATWEQGLAPGLTYLWGREDIG